MKRSSSASSACSCGIAGASLIAGASFIAPLPLSTFSFVRTYYRRCANLTFTTRCAHLNFSANEISLGSRTNFASDDVNRFLDAFSVRSSAFCGRVNASGGLENGSSCSCAVKEWQFLDTLLKKRCLRFGNGGFKDYGDGLRCGRCGV